MKGVSDCIAMSEDGDWFAFPGDWTRGEVIRAIAQDSSWTDVLRVFHVKRGHVVQGEEQGGSAWYWQTEASDADAIPVWIAKRR